MSYHFPLKFGELYCGLMIDFRHLIPDGNDGKQFGREDIPLVIFTTDSLYEEHIKWLLKSYDQTICKDGQNFVLKKFGKDFQFFLG